MYRHAHVNLVTIGPERAVWLRLTAPISPKVTEFSLEALAVVLPVTIGTQLLWPAASTAASLPMHSQTQASSRARATLDTFGMARSVQPHLTVLI